MTEVTPINAVQGLRMQHKDKKDRLGDLALRVHTLSYYLLDACQHGNRNLILNDSQDGIIFIEVIEDELKEMKELIGRTDEIIDEIDEVEGRSL